MPTSITTCFLLMGIITAIAFGAAGIVVGLVGLVWEAFALSQVGR